MRVCSENAETRHGWQPSARGIEAFQQLFGELRFRVNRELSAGRVEESGVWLCTIIAFFRSLLIQLYRG